MGILKEGPDNNAIRSSVEELKKLNSSNKVIMGIASATFIVSIIGIVLALWK